MDQKLENRITLGELLDGWEPYVDDLLLHDPDGPGECVVRRGELVIPAQHAEAVIDRLGRWVDRVHYDEDLPAARVCLRASERERCVEIARDARGPHASAADGVAPNHVHFGSPVLYGSPVLFGTGAQAKPAFPVPCPDEQRWATPVTVGMLDTGLDPHPWFAQRPWFEEVPEELDADDDSGQDRQAGHGTFVAGLVLQHAPGAVLRPRRVLSSLGFTDDVRVAAGLRAFHARAAKDSYPEVVLVTAGCHTSDDVCPPILRAALTRMWSSVVVAAAGNHSSPRPFWPAALPHVIGVAATGSDGSRAAFSNHGSWVDAAAPGADVVSSYVRLVPGSPASRSYGYARWSGTSFAAPQVAARAAVALHEGHDPAAATKIACQRYPFGR